MPLAAFVGDSCPYEVQLIFVFGGRMIAVCGFFFIEDPNGMLMFITVVGALVFSNLENVVVNSMFLKMLEADTRATMNGLLNSVAQMGSLAFHEIGIVLIRNYGV